MRLWVDATWGEGWSESIVRWVTQFFKTHNQADIEIVLFGCKTEIEKVLASQRVTGKLWDKIKIINCEEKIWDDFKPEGKDWIKKDASLTKLITCLGRSEKNPHETQLDGWLSAGNTAAFVMWSILSHGRWERKTPVFLASWFPNSKSPDVIAWDMWAIPDIKPEEILCISQMLIAYCQARFNELVPTYLLNIWVEAWKGWKQQQNFFNVLSEFDHFHGNVEPESLLNTQRRTREGKVMENGRKIILADAFTMNIALKSIKTWSLYVIQKLPYLWKILQKLSTWKSGGALLLGVNAILVKVNGNSTPDIIANALWELYEAAKSDIITRTKEELKILRSPL